ncbi:glycoside hydrolase domain-containing protein [Bacillus sp. MUM 116]|uniref:glycoside hydrolase domain-containing protein n=1 Tax=Bacillus sp. MUM 116 TaxID=1678002 RepID=UPI0009F48CA1|nr:glycoside hydrolase domain-containing protein [Bacillus sp. MUM 116]
MKTRKWFWTIVLSAILVLPLLFVFFNQNGVQQHSDSPQTQPTMGNHSPESGKEPQKQPQSQPPSKKEPKQNPSSKTDDKSKSKILWGADSATKVDKAFLKCVKENYGKPAVFGRYLETKEGISLGLTQKEVDFLHGQGIKVIPIFNHFTDATVYKKGVSEAKEAITYAKKIEIPKGTAIFADIEPKFPVDDGFIRGWVDTLMKSVYKPGIYGVFTKDGSVTSAYKKAIGKDKDIQKHTIIWSSNPGPGITGKDSAPKFKPNAPDKVNVSIWQYGIDGKTCNIDTNLIQSDVLDELW